MPNVTVISFLSSLISYGMGFSKISVLNNALATGYFVLAIFFAVIGFFVFTLKLIESKKLLKLSHIEFRGKTRQEKGIAS